MPKRTGQISDEHNIGTYIELYTGKSGVNGLFYFIKIDDHTFIADRKVNPLITVESLEAGIGKRFILSNNSVATLKPMEYSDYVTMSKLYTADVWGANNFGSVLPAYCYRDWMVLVELCKTNDLVKYPTGYFAFGDWNLGNYTSDIIYQSYRYDYSDKSPGYIYKSIANKSVGEPNISRVYCCNPCSNLSFRPKLTIEYIDECYQCDKGLFSYK